MYRSLGENKDDTEEGGLMGLTLFRLVGWGGEEKVLHCPPLGGPFCSDKLGGRKEEHIIEGNVGPRGKEGSRIRGLVLLMACWIWE